MPTKDEFRTIVHSCLRKILSSDEVTISDDETFMDYGVDSLDRMNLLLELEQQTGLELGEIDMEQVNTINLLYDHISK